MIKNIGIVVVSLLVAAMIGGFILGIRATNSVNAQLGTIQSDVTNLKNAPAPTPMAMPTADGRIDQVITAMTGISNTLGAQATAIADTNRRIDNLLDREISDMWFLPKAGTGNRVYVSGSPITATVYLPGQYSGSEKMTTWQMVDGSVVPGQTVTFTAPTTPITKTYQINVTAQIKGQTNSGQFKFMVVPAPKPATASIVPTPIAGSTGVTVLGSGINTNTLGLNVSMNTTGVNQTLTISNTASGDTFEIGGIPAQIDGNTVDQAEFVAAGASSTNGFTNTLGVHTQGWLALKGKLVIGYQVCNATDSDIAQMTDPVMKNWAQMVKNSGGAITCINPSNQTLFEGNSGSFNLPGGGFMAVSGNHFDAMIDGAVIKAKGGKGLNTLMFVRGYYGDGKQDTDENRSVEFTGYSDGHLLATRYSGQPNGGFVSQGQFEQMVGMSNHGDTNCGDAGCTRTLAMFYDVNTKALTVIYQAAPGQPWQLLFANWTPKTGK